MDPIHTKQQGPSGTLCSHVKKKAGQAGGGKGSEKNKMSEKDWKQKIIKKLEKE